MKNYKDQEYEFGIDTASAAALTGLNQTESKGLVQSLSKNDSGIVNAISVIMSAIVLADRMNTRNETQRIDALFDLLDFNQAGKINLDELTILFICLASAIAAILDKKESTSEEIITTLTLNLFDELQRVTTGTVAKAEFQKWCLDTLVQIGQTDFDVIFETFCAGTKKTLLRIGSQECQEP